VLHQGQSTYDSTLLLKGTFPFSYLEGNLTNKSKAFPPVARPEQAQNILFMDEKISLLSSNNATCRTRFVLKRPLRCILKVQEAITLPTSWFGGGVPSGGDTSSFL
jgi:hypothetical protein